MVVRYNTFMLIGDDHMIYVLLGVYQQTTSGLTITNQDCYELNKGCFSIYGFEYKPG